MTRIVLVGAGSVEFTRNLLGDILSFEALRDADLVLHDIDADRLATAERMARWTAGALHAEPTITAELDRRTALRDADYVINTIQVGGARATQLDFEIPGRYGLQYTINDTINIGGVFRGLRSIPVTLGIAADMADVCPDALFLNYTNPMAMLVRAVDEGRRRPDDGPVPLGVLGRPRPRRLPRRPVRGGRRALRRRQPPGVRSCASSTGAGTCTRTCGRSSTPARSPTTTSIRADLFRRFGFYPTEADDAPGRVQPVVHPQGRQIEPYHVPIGEYLPRVANHLEEYAETKRMLDAGEPFEIERSGEYAAVIINAIETGEPARIVANVMNDGGAMIANLAGDACVEVPALVDGLGVHPTPIGALPPQCAAYIRPAVDCQELTVRAALDQDRDLVYHAVLTDPIIAARLTLDEAWRLTDELIAAEAEWLPAWLGGSAPDWI